MTSLKDILAAKKAAATQAIELSKLNVEADTCEATAPVSPTNTVFIAPTIAPQATVHSVAPAVKMSIKEILAKKHLLSESKEIPSVIIPSSVPQYIEKEKKGSN